MEGSKNHNSSIYSLIMSPPRSSDSFPTLHVLVADLNASIALISSVFRVSRAVSLVDFHAVSIAVLRVARSLIFHAVSRALDRVDIILMIVVENFENELASADSRTVTALATHESCSGVRTAPVAFPFPSFGGRVIPDPLFSILLGISIPLPPIVGLPISHRDDFPLPIIPDPMSILP